MSISEELGERGSVEMAAGRIDYRERGSGPALVFAHGAAVNGDLWRKVAPELAGEHRCVVPDLPLGGHSTPLREGADLSLFGAAEIIAGFLEALDLADVTLIANDTGGALSQGLVGRWPERVGRLVLTSCDAFGNYPPKAVAYLKPTSRVPPALWLLTKAMHLKLAQRTPFAYGWATRRPIEPRIMDSFLGSLRSDPGIRRDFANLLRSARATDSEEASESVRRFEGPALVAWAAEDKFFPRRHGERLAELLPRGAFALVEDSRTFIPEDNPQRLVELLRDFLA